MRARWWPPFLAVAVVVAFVLVVGRVGRRLTQDGVVLHLLGGWVLRGQFDVVWTPRVWLPVVVGLAGVLAGPALAARLSADGRAQVGAAYTWTGIGQRLLAIVDAASEGRRR